MDNIKVKPYSEKYREDIRFICLKTADKNAFSQKRKITLLSTYCDYYIENEKDNCFILYNEKENRAVGYILSSKEYKKYIKIFSKKYLSTSSKSGFSSFFESFSAMAVPSVFCKKYPAHLHIDILKEYQHMGYGSLLMKTLLKKLKSQNVKGVMLCVDSKNQNAIRFYKKMGFKNITASKIGTVMGQKL